MSVPFFYRVEFEFVSETGMEGSINQFMLSQQNIVVEKAEQSGGVYPKLSRQNRFRYILLQFCGIATAWRLGQKVWPPPVKKIRALDLWSMPYPFSNC